MRRNQYFVFVRHFCVCLRRGQTNNEFLPRLLGPAMFSRIKLVIDLIRQLDGEYRALKERIDTSPDLPVDAPTVPFCTVPPVQLPIDNDSPLPSHVDVLVIGSGITGVSCTRTLLRHGPPGLRVLVLEARDVCSGATGRYV